MNITYPYMEGIKREADQLGTPIPTKKHKLCQVYSPGAIKPDISYTNMKPDIAVIVAYLEFYKQEFRTGTYAKFIRDWHHQLLWIGGKHKTVEFQGFRARIAEQ